MVRSSRNSLLISDRASSVSCRPWHHLAERLADRAHHRFGVGGRDGAGVEPGAGQEGRERIAPWRRAQRRAPARRAAVRPVPGPASPAPGAALAPDAHGLGGLGRVGGATVFSAAADRDPHPSHPGSRRRRTRSPGSPPAAGRTRPPTGYGRPPHRHRPSRPPPVPPTDRSRRGSAADAAAPPGCRSNSSQRPGTAARRTRQIELGERVVIRRLRVAWQVGIAGEGVFGAAKCTGIRRGGNGSPNSSSSRSSAGSAAAADSSAAAICTLTRYSPRPIQIAVPESHGVATAQPLRRLVDEDAVVLVSVTRNSPASKSIAQWLLDRCRSGSSSTQSLSAPRPNVRPRPSKLRLSIGVPCGSSLRINVKISFIAVRAHLLGSVTHDLNSFEAPLCRIYRNMRQRFILLADRPADPLRNVLSAAPVSALRNVDALVQEPAKLLRRRQGVAAVGASNPAAGHCGAGQLVTRRHRRQIRRGKALAAPECRRRRPAGRACRSRPLPPRSSPSGDFVGGLRTQVSASVTRFFDVSSPAAVASRAHRQAHHTASRFGRAWARKQLASCNRSSSTSLSRKAFGDMPSDRSGRNIRRLFVPAADLGGRFRVDLLQFAHTDAHQIFNRYPDAASGRSVDHRYAALQGQHCVAFHRRHRRLRVQLPRRPLHRSAPT